MGEVIFKTMVEVLAILAIATKEVNRSRASESVSIHRLLLANFSLGKFMKRLLGRNDIEDALKRVDSLTQEGFRMATAAKLAFMHGKRMDDNVTEFFCGGAQDAFLALASCL